MGIEVGTAMVVGSLLGAGATVHSGRKARKAAKRTAQQAQDEMTETAREERGRRRSIQRAALQSQPSMFDMLRGPGG